MLSSDKARQKKCVSRLSSRKSSPNYRIYDLNAPLLKLVSDIKLIYHAVCIINKQSFSSRVSSSPQFELLFRNDIERVFEESESLSKDLVVIRQKIADVSLFCKRFLKIACKYFNVSLIIHFCHGKQYLSESFGKKNGSIISALLLIDGYYVLKDGQEFTPAIIDTALKEFNTKS